MSTIAELADKIRSLPRVLQERIVPGARDAVAAVLHADLAAGRSPDGKTWKPRKDGQAALPAAADEALTVTVVGKDTIFVRAQFPYAFHNRGARGMPVRAVVPTKITPAMGAAIDRVVNSEIEKALS